MSPDGTLLRAVSEPGAPTPPPPPPTAALASAGPGNLLTPTPASTPRTVLGVSSLSQADRRELRKLLSDADADDGL